MEKELFLNELYCEHSMDQNDPFESAYSSMVSSPTASNATGNGENIVLRELIGRLGSICNSGEIEISPHSYRMNGNNSTNTSCYSTPLNSPPKIRGGNLQIPGNSHFQNLSPLGTDLGFAERAARFSCFSKKGLVGLSQKFEPDRFSRVLSNGSGSRENMNGEFKEAGVSEFVDSGENSSVSEQIPIGGIGLNAQIDANSRKRKGVQRGKAKATPSSTPTKDANVASESSELSEKRSKLDDESGNRKQSKDNSKPLEAPKDYIHVRARRGQATDAHSLAERVRREKISEKMKFLQDLVPGCNKVTGKAVMLDEIINYVQSLQRQVEFLSMKLSIVNPRMNLEAEDHMSKDMMQTRGSLSNHMYPAHSYPFQPETPFQANHFNADLDGNQIDHFSQSASQIPTFWDDDLHSIVQMGFGQNETHNFHGGQMKVEL